jgi:FtsZ-interacting cell division protein YlmF
MLAFARSAVRHLPRVNMTVVDLPEVDKEQARRLAEEIGARFVLRPYF